MPSCRSYYGNSKTPIPIASYSFIGESHVAEDSGLYSAATEFRSESGGMLPRLSNLLNVPRA